MTELTNPRSDRVKAVRALSGRSARLRHGQYVIEGPQALREAVRFAPDTIRDIYLTPQAQSRYSDIYDEAEAAGLYIHVASLEVLMAMSPDCQGLLGVAYLPQRAELSLTDELLLGARNIAVMCSVRDPGNAGTIIRAADAAGADLVILTAGSVDVHSPKVVRSTAGSLYHLPVLTGVNFEDLISTLHTSGVQILAAAGESALDLDDLLDEAAAAKNRTEDQAGQGQASRADLTRPTAWLFGNEAQGLSVEEKEHADFSVSVPIRGKAESLNVATAATVCLYASSRAQRR